MTPERAAKKRKQSREYHAQRYATDPEFRKAEAERKRAWYQKNHAIKREGVRQQVAGHRAAKKLKPAPGLVSLPGNGLEP